MLVSIYFQNLNEKSVDIKVHSFVLTIFEVNF